MARLRLIAILALASILSAAATNARADTITTDTAVPGVLKIDGTGTFTVSVNRMFFSLKFVAVNTATMQQNVINANRTGGNWSATLSLTSGTYDVYAILSTLDGTNPPVVHVTQSNIKLGIVVP